MKQHNDSDYWPKKRRDPAEVRAEGPRSDGTFPWWCTECGRFSPAARLPARICLHCWFERRAAKEGA